MRLLLAICLIIPSIAGCGRERAAPPPAAPAAHAEPPSDRIGIPDSVRQNLGITFVKVEKRNVASTLRVPGRFELLPTARHQYHLSFKGRVDLLVKQYQPVEVGTPLFQLDSPDWHRLRLELEEDQARMERLQQEVLIAQATKKEAELNGERLRKRIEGLKSAEVRRIELENQLAENEASLPRLEAQIQAKRKELQAAREHFPMEMEAAAALSGMTVEKLSEPVGTPPQPRWRTLEKFIVTATQPGIVESLGVTRGAWADVNALILTTVDPSLVRFRAVGLQSDIARLRSGLPVKILPPDRAVGSAEDSIDAELTLGLEASAEQRTIELIGTPRKLAPWCRPGVSSLMEITQEGGQPELAIPVASTTQDGLTRIYFRRDPKDPDKVIRVEGDFGISDGKWITVKSGVKAGDEVVLDGVYELRLTGTGKTAGGHFHADGTFHPDGTPEPK
jgi:multidrug efflux pump subunit AcrA (membrane-fusion protein)